MQKLAKWHRSGPGLLAFGVIELAAAYGFASLAIDRGNLWWYILALTFLVGALQNFVKLTGHVIHGGRKTS